jgi:mannose-6-phosphate isomerase-like protein (cupin superfamily)
MADYTLLRFVNVPPQHFGQDPTEVDVRFYRNQLKMSGGGVSVIKLGPGATSNAHKHKQQEEVYLLVSGDVEVKLGDDIVKLSPYDAVRVPKETVRALRNIGNTPSTVIAIGTPNTGPSDGIDVDDFWPTK